MLIFVRLLHEANFSLYIESLSELIPWFFALDQTNYARWLSVHLRDMITLSHPAIYAEFKNGHFAVFKSRKPFSAIALDHAHVNEQNNHLVKDDGGAVGLLQSSVALRRWMVAGPELARGNSRI